MLWYVLYGSDDKSSIKDAVVIAWSHNAELIHEYCLRIESICELFLKLYSYAVENEADLIEQISFDTGIKGLELDGLRKQFALDELIFVPFRNGTRYSLVTKYEYGVIYHETMEELDMFIENNFFKKIIALSLMLRFIRPSERQQLSQVLKPFTTLVTRWNALMMDGKYGKVAEEVDPIGVYQLTEDKYTMYGQEFGGSSTPPFLNIRRKEVILHGKHIENCIRTIQRKNNQNAISRESERDVS